MKYTRYEKFRQAVPKPVKNLVAPIRNLFVAKEQSEMQYWRNRFKSEGQFENDWYQPIMLNMADEKNDDFMANKVVADFGCGPRGSLAWAKKASLRVGIDVLAAEYAREFPSEISKHNMIYVCSTEEIIPMPSGLVDLMFTMNALDHVENLENMCSEICRVLKKGGTFFGSFNLNEPPTAAEPQTLTENILDQKLLKMFRKQKVRFGGHRPGGSRYADMFEGTSNYVENKPGYMWFKGTLI